MNKISVLFLFLIMSSCSNTKVNKYRSITLREMPKNKQFIILPERVSGDDKCLQSVKKYAINQAISDALDNRYPEAYGLANITITQKVEVFFINLHRCFSVVGQPIVEKKK